ncbi:hypothetical protein Gotri_014179 [Gossypium trilobum]|uniref:Uncharacterized protein n=1 Tax=Gossypium trilobum TaxID=34281 RepID=A0A7J9DVW5_9ROSI|nr:hypothetical protein [Gossypium trilobum]
MLQGEIIFLKKGGWVKHQKNNGKKLKKKY